jgi:hypothetical protein
MGGAKSLASSFCFLRGKHSNLFAHISILGMDDESFDGTFLGVGLLASKDFFSPF